MRCDQLDLVHSPHRPTPTSGGSGEEGGGEGVKVELTATHPEKMPFSRCKTTVDRAGQMAPATTDECRGGLAIGSGQSRVEAEMGDYRKEKARNGVLRRNCPWGRR